MSEQNVYDEAFGAVEQQNQQPQQQQYVPPVTKYDDIVNDGEVAILNLQISGILLMVAVIAVACICMYICCNVPIIQQRRRNLWTLMGMYALFVVVVSMRRFCCT